MFNFNFGNKKPDIKQYAIVGIVLTSIIAALSQCTHIKENDIRDLLDEIQREYFPQTIINDFIIKEITNDQKEFLKDNINYSMKCLKNLIDLFMQLHININ
jgi:hypothetical protein